VQTGQTLTEISIPLAVTPTSRISGTVIGRDGRPFNNGMIMAVTRNSTFVGLPPLMTQIKPDGTFLLANVTPGDYIPPDDGRANARRWVPSRRLRRLRSTAQM